MAKFATFVKILRTRVNVRSLKPGSELMAKQGDRMSRTFFLAAMLTGLPIALPANAQPSPASAPQYPSGVWDLERQYPDQAAWDADRRRLMAMITALPALKGTAGKGPAQLADVLDRAREARSLAGKMARFSLLMRELDTSSDAAGARFDAARASESAVEVTLSWLDQDVGAIGLERVRQWIKDEPRLVRHRQRINRIFVQREYQAPAAEREIIAKMGRWPEAATDAANALTEADLGWTTIKDASGKDVKADYSTYSRLRRSPEKRVRDALSESVLTRLKGVEEPLGMLLTRRIEGENVIARSRGFENSIDASFMLNDRIPATAWRAMIEASRSNRDTLLRIGRVLKKVHGLTEMGFGDFYARYAAEPLVIPFAQAVNLTVAASAPFGKDYQTLLRTRLAEPWIHYRPLPNKSTGVGVYWQVGGGPPYTIFTYNDDVASSQLVAHSSLPMMRYADIPGELSPERREEDPAVQGNALWYVGRFLHDEELYRRTADREQRISQLTDQLNLLWRVYGLLAVSAEFEQKIVESVNAGAPPTGSQLSTEYLGLLRHYFESPNGAKVDELFSGHWMTQSQIFYSHTQVVFPMSLALGAYWVDRVKAGDRKALYGLGLTLTPEGSQYSYDLLLAAGIDPTRKELYDAIYRRIDGVMDRLEQEIAKR